MPGTDRMWMEGSSGGVTVVLPTLNEVGSLPAVVSGIDRTLSANPGTAVSELLFVDDGSSDGTLEYLDDLQFRRAPYSVRVIRRDRPMGSASAEAVGIRAAANPIVVKMDADGQHPPALLPTMIRSLTDDVDMVIASRYIPGGANSWSAVRGLISRVAKLLSQIVLPSARGVRDPISGYFVVRKPLAANLDSRRATYKLLLYLLALNPSARVKEIPVVMTSRCAGESKIVSLSPRFIIRYCGELLSYRRASQRSPLLSTEPARTSEPLPKGVT